MPVSTSKISQFVSKILFTQRFEDQFYIPIPPKKIETGLLSILEKRLEQKLPHEIKIDRPIFIIGAPRSGTSMLYDLLCLHEDAAYVNNLTNTYNEQPLAVSALCKKFGLNIRGERFLKDSVDVDLYTPAEPFTFWGKWFARDIESLHWKEQTRKDLGEKKVLEIKRDLQKILSLFPTSKPRFVCKFATIQPEIELIQEIFPDAMFVNIIRDGRFVANSLIKLYDLSNSQLKKINHPLLKHIIPYPRFKSLSSIIQAHGERSLECTARIWDETINYIDELKPRLKHYHEFRYEDLMEKPQVELEKLFSFCELAWPTHEAFNNYVKKIGKTTHKNNYEGFELVESLCPQNLKRYGYL
jgi:omega-hydroxy-beta-dihydromenaquinone-9 sulfotransferase